ncbi:MAG TPA: hypothetical protein VHA33_24915 [Candidatus Angelobacter sp.]|jgi:hypothetical protein|nr:hypothetical protein [Candidatus Angelobacter sp.]
MFYVDLVAGLVAPTLQIWLAGVMIRRKLYLKFPLFFSYTVYSVLIIAVRLPFAHQPQFFYALYWITEIIYGALSLLGIGEVFSDVLSPQTKGKNWWRLVPTLVLLALVIGSLLWAIYRPFRPNFWGRLGAGAYSFDIGVLGVGAFAYLLELFRLKPFSGTLQRPHSAAILKGFGVFGLLGVVAHLARSYFGSQFEGWFRYIPPGAYIMATLTWLAAFRRPEPPGSTVPPTPELLGGLKEELERDQETLKKIEKDLPSWEPISGSCYSRGGTRCLSLTP